MTAGVILVEAEEPYRKGLKIHEQLFDPSHPESQGPPARTYNNVGVFYSETNQMETVEDLYQKAPAIRKRVADTNPTNPDHQSDLALSYSNRTLAELGEHAQAATEAQAVATQAPQVGDIL
jgi:hypothetical protein